MEEQFKKFVEDLEKREKAQRENKKKLAEAEKSWSTRDLNKKYREDPGNRTVWSR